MFDGKVGVNLGNVLDEKSSIEFLFTNHVEHADLGHKWTNDCGIDFIYRFRLLAFVWYTRVKLFFEELLNLRDHLCKIVMD